MARPPLLIFALPAALAASLGACAEGGAYPSLAPRPMEAELAAADEAPRPPPLPDDPELQGRMMPLIAEARRGQAEFEVALPAARAAVARAGGAGSDGWVEAQQAVSRTEAARATTTGALADLDALTLAEARRRAVSESDLARMRAALAEIERIADRQHEAIAAMEESLSRR
jgi:hypothetical protein